MHLDPSTNTQWLKTLEQLLSVIWLRQTPPRLLSGIVVGKRCEKNLLHLQQLAIVTILSAHDTVQVTAIKRNGRNHQLLIATGISKEDPATLGSVFILKAFRIAQIGPIEMKSHLDCMRAADGPTGITQLFEDFQEGDFHYMVFPKWSFTLRDVLNDQSLTPLPPSHVQEISFQLVNTVRLLHREFPVHGDICPENIELIHDERVVHRTYNRDRSIFNEKSTLYCTKLVLAFYGDCGIHRTLPGTDQYRAPEAVFGSKLSVSADAFSVGCVVAELVLGEPLFPPCEERSSVYRNEKALLYDAVAGRFSEEMAAKIELFHPFTMDMSEIRPIRYPGISSTVDMFIQKTLYIEWIFDQDDPAIGEVIAGLVRTTPRARRSLASTLQCDYFHKRY